MSSSFSSSWTVAQLAPLSMGFSRPDYWSGLPFPSAGDLPELGFEPASPTLARGFFTTDPPGSRSYFNKSVRGQCGNNYSLFL